MKKWLVFCVFLALGISSPGLAQTTDAELESMLSAGMWDSVIERGRGQSEPSLLLMVASLNLTKVP